MDATSPHSIAFRRIAEEATSLLLAAACAGCDAPGVLLCTRCRAALVAEPITRSLGSGIEVRAALSFDGVVARCIRTLKEEGNTLLARPLGAALATVLPPDVFAVPIPTSRAAYRRRGYRVPDLLLRAAGARRVNLLRSVGRPSDQRGLGRAERTKNVTGSLRARRRGAGEAVVVVDDVITTGATLTEASRVLEGAGFHVVGVVALAATARRDDAQSARREDE